MRKNFVFKVLMFFLIIIIFFKVVSALFNAANYGRRQVGACRYAGIYEGMAKQNTEDGRFEEFSDMEARCEDTSKIYWDAFFEILKREITGKYLPDY